MGWMSWQTFRCNPFPTPGGPPPVANCSGDKATTTCISEALFQGVADSLLSTGLAAAGYTRVHVDDCYQGSAPGSGLGRDYVTGALQADSIRFPAGMAALGAYLHSRGLSFGHYSAASVNTCDGFPGSKDFEFIDAETFAGWGVSYLKLDGCAIPRGDHSYYATGVRTLNAEFASSARATLFAAGAPPSSAACADTPSPTASVAPLAERHHARRALSQGHPNAHAQKRRPPAWRVREHGAAHRAAFCQPLPASAPAGRPRAA